jgi:hypothetical protein
MRIGTYSLGAIFLLGQFSTSAAQDRVQQIRHAELSKTPIAAGPLRIT